MRPKRPRDQAPKYPTVPTIAETVETSTWLSELLARDLKGDIDADEDEALRGADINVEPLQLMTANDVLNTRIGEALIFWEQLSDRIPLVREKSADEGTWRQSGTHEMLIDFDMNESDLPENPPDPTDPCVDEVELYRYYVQRIMCSVPRVEALREQMSEGSVPLRVLQATKYLHDNPSKRPFGDYHLNLEINYAPKIQESTNPADGFVYATGDPATARNWASGLGQANAKKGPPVGSVTSAAERRVAAAAAAGGQAVVGKGGERIVQAFSRPCRTVVCFVLYKSTPKTEVVTGTPVLPFEHRMFEVEALEHNTLQEVLEAMPPCLSDSIADEDKRRPESLWEAPVAPQPSRKALSLAGAFVFMRGVFYATDPTVEETLNSAPLPPPRTMCQQDLSGMKRDVTLSVQQLNKDLKAIRKTKKRPKASNGSSDPGANRPPPGNANRKTPHAPPSQGVETLNGMNGGAGAQTARAPDLLWDFISSMQTRSLDSPGAVAAAPRRRPPPELWMKRWLDVGRGDWSSKKAQLMQDAKALKQAENLSAAAVAMTAAAASGTATEEEATAAVRAANEASLVAIKRYGLEPGVFEEYLSVATAIAAENATAGQSESGRATPRRKEPPPVVTGGHERGGTGRGPGCGNARERGTGNGEGEGDSPAKRKRGLDNTDESTDGSSAEDDSEYEQLTSDDESGEGWGPREPATTARVALRKAGANAEEGMEENEATSSKRASRGAKGKRGCGRGKDRAGKGKGKSKDRGKAGREEEKEEDSDGDDDREEEVEEEEEEQGGRKRVSSSSATVAAGRVQRKGGQGTEAGAGNARIKGKGKGKNSPPVGQPEEEDEEEEGGDSDSRAKERSRPSAAAGAATGAAASTEGAAGNQHGRCKPGSRGTSKTAKTCKKGPANGNTAAANVHARSGEPGASSASGEDIPPGQGAIGGASKRGGCGAEEVGRGTEPGVRKRPGPVKKFEGLDTCRPHQEGVIMRKKMGMPDDGEAIWASDVTVGDLRPVLGERYTFVHHCDCTHFFVVADIRLEPVPLAAAASSSTSTRAPWAGSGAAAAGSTLPGGSGLGARANDGGSPEYPRLLYRMRPNSRRCDVCKTMVGVKISLDHPLSDRNPLVCCSKCMDMLYYDSDHKPLTGRLAGQKPSTSPAGDKHSVSPVDNTAPVPSPPEDNFPENDSSVSLPGGGRSGGRAMGGEVEGGPKGWKTSNIYYER